MAKYCPISKEAVVYLECLDCDDKEYCKNGENFTGKDSEFELESKEKSANETK